MELNPFLLSLPSLQDDPERVEDDFFGKCVEWRSKLGEHLKILRDEAHDGELAAFASYAVAFPDGFLALVDTYDVTKYVTRYQPSFYPLLLC